MAPLYYPPNISEFYVGFEYEAKLNSGEWEKLTFIPSFSFNFEEFSISLNNVRVKYLDSEDIESLGIRILDNYDDYFDCFIKPTKIDGETYGARLEYFEKTKQVEIYLEYTGGQNISHIQTLFKGTIKNKSELKKLLAQLNIQ